MEFDRHRREAISSLAFQICCCFNSCILIYPVVKGTEIK
jgi:hypothetical protein